MTLLSEKCNQSSARGVVGIHRIVVVVVVFFMWPSSVRAKFCQNTDIPLRGSPRAAMALYPVCQFWQKSELRHSPIHGATIVHSFSKLFAWVCLFKTYRIALKYPYNSLV